VAPLESPGLGRGAASEHSTLPSSEHTGRPDAGFGKFRSADAVRAVDGRVEELPSNGSVDSPAGDPGAQQLLAGYGAMLLCRQADAGRSESGSAACRHGPMLTGKSSNGLYNCNDCATTSSRIPCSLRKRSGPRGRRLNLLRLGSELPCTMHDDPSPQPFSARVIASTILSEVITSAILVIGSAIFSGARAFLNAGTSCRP